MAKKPDRISLLDVYLAVSAPKAFSIHGYDAQKACPVSCHIKEALEKALVKPQRALEARLGKITLAEIVSAVRRA